MNKRPRICINGITENGEIRGPVRYILELTRHLDSDSFDIYLIAGSWQQQIYRSLEEKVRVCYVDIKKDKISRALFFAFSMPRLLRTYRIDLYHIPDTNPLPYRRGKSSVVSTIHDSAEFVVPQRFSWIQAMYRRRISKKQAHGSDIVITVSESSKRDLVKYLKLSPERVIAIPLGVEPPSLGVDTITASSKHTATPYILYVGVLENAKNVDRIVEAYAQLPKEVQVNYELYLVGRKGNGYHRVEELIQENKLVDRIKVFGYVSEEDLQAIYHGASIFVYLSEYEGFGLPVLEAMRYGLPVLAANRSSIPEVAGGAALLTETDVPAIVRSLERLLHNSEVRRVLADKGNIRVGECRWEDTAKKTEDVYYRILAQKSQENGQELV